MPNSLLYALHDRDSHPLIPPGGWCVESLALAEHPQPENWAAIRGDINWILRLNWAHNGKDGTIPHPGQYDEYAKLCADYVASCKGAEWFIIANEPNHRQEWPNGVQIEPEQYAEAFNRCYAAILNVRPEAKVLVAAVAPWNNEIGYDWLAYYRRMVGAILACDGFAVHGYTHGADPSLIFNYDTVEGWYWHFPVVYQTIEAIPDRFDYLPVHVTEADQGDDAWVDTNSGWVQNAYQSIHGYNQASGVQPILSLALYRWRGDKYEIYNKPQVQADFRAAVARGYSSPTLSLPAKLKLAAAEKSAEPKPKPKDTHIPAVSTGTSPVQPMLPPREIDPRAAERGTVIETPPIAPGQQYWRVKRLYTPNEQESDRLGPDRHILANVLQDGKRLVGMPLLVTWGGGGPSERATIHTKQNDNFAFSADHALTPGDFTLSVADGKPSEIVRGIKMGAQTPQGWNPGAHTSTLVDWELVTMPASPQPTPAPKVLFTRYVVVPDGANIRTLPPRGDIVASVPYGEVVEVIGTEEGLNWYEVRYGDKTGWMRADLLGDKPPAPTPAPTPQPAPGMPALGHPVAEPQYRRVTQGFGENPDNYKQFVVDGVPLKGHNGIDFATPIGSQIVAAADGRVVEVADEGKKGYGRYIKLVHPWGESLYAHLDAPYVTVGDIVLKGEIIGLSGNTGNSTGPHLHFGLRVSPFNRRDGWGGYTDPAPYLINVPGSQPTPSEPQPTPDLKPLIKYAAAEFKLPWQLVASQAQAESSFGKKLLSDAGAQGVMHIMPDTWAEWAPKIGAGDDPFNHRHNIRVGAAYMQWLLTQTGNDPYQALIAYGWGIGNWLSDKPRPSIWIEYANKIMHGHDTLVSWGAI